MVTRVGPATLAEYVGQDKIRSQLEIFIQAARGRGEALEDDAASDITALEREDIEILSAALYKIPKTVEKIVERVTVLRERLVALVGEAIQAAARRAGSLSPRAAARARQKSAMRAGAGLTPLTAPASAGVRSAKATAPARAHSGRARK